MTRDELREKMFYIVKGISNQSSTCGGFDDYECKEEAENILDTILTALQEPTEEMLHAVSPINGNRVWQAILAASPLAPEGGGKI